MAKRNPRNTPATPEPSTSRNTLILLAAGCLLVGGLVVWALTRTVEPTPVDSTATAVQQTAQPTPLGTTTSPLATPPLQTTMPSAIPPSTTAPSFPPAATDSIDGAAVQASADAVPRMSAEDLREKLNRNEVTVIDVRDQAAYMQGHIPRALHMPFATVQLQMQTLPKGKPIVTYCTWPAEESSAGAALVLKQRGNFTDVSALHGGLDAWRRIGGQTVSGAM